MAMNFLGEQRQYSPLMLKFLKEYQKNPQSLVFAPLAEGYRKMGMIDEAIEVCKDGLSKHPEYISGSVALARCFYEKREFDKVIELMDAVVKRAPDNILALRLLADSFIEIDHQEEALKYYKFILYYNPSDEFVAEKVSEFEDKILSEKGLNHLLRPESFDLNNENVNFENTGDDEILFIGQMIPPKFNPFTANDDFVIRPAKGAITDEAKIVRENKILKLQLMLENINKYRLERDSNVRNKPV